MDHGYQSWTRLNNVPNDRVLVPLDVIKTRCWGLVHHAMFHTYPHHDAEGYATFIQIISGTKFWVIMRPREVHETWAKLYYDQMQFHADSLMYDDDWEKWLITARPGDIM